MNYLPPYPSLKPKPYERDILTKAEPPKKVEQKPVNILLVGRTCVGSSSLINTIFNSELAVLYVSPSTDKIQNYHWTTDTGEILNLCDTPGYEQVKRDDLRDLVIDDSIKADLLLLLLVTPALDPALQVDVDFLKEIKAQVADLAIIIIVTQVDKLYPIREWQPPYIWKIGNKPKEISIREATGYRNQLLGNHSNLVVTIIINDLRNGRNTWNLDELSLGYYQP